MAGKSKKYSSFGGNTTAGKNADTFGGGKFAGKTDVEAAGEAGTPMTQSGITKANKKSAGPMTKTDNQG